MGAFHVIVFAAVVAESITFGAILGYTRGYRDGAAAGAASGISRATSGCTPWWPSKPHGLRLCPPVK